MLRCLLEGRGLGSFLLGHRQGGGSCTLIPAWSHVPASHSAPPGQVRSHLATLAASDKSPTGPAPLPGSWQGICQHTSPCWLLPCTNIVTGDPNSHLAIQHPTYHPPNHPTRTPIRRNGTNETGIRGAGADCTRKESQPWSGPLVGGGKGKRAGMCPDPEARFDSQYILNSCIDFRGTTGTLCIAKIPQTTGQPCNITTTRARSLVNVQRPRPSQSHPEPLLRGVGRAARAPSPARRSPSGRRVPTRAPFCAVPTVLISERTPQSGGYLRTPCRPLYSVRRHGSYINQSTCFFLRFQTGRRLSTTMIPLTLASLPGRHCAWCCRPAGG